MKSSYGFPPLAAPDATRLILGSMPGEASLVKGEYYAFKQNAFWPLMERLFGIPSTDRYEKRLAALMRERIALWDVVKCCRRKGSLDSQIDETTMELNDIPDLLLRCSAIDTIYLNGGKAETIYKRRIVPLLRERAITHVRHLRLPSTSPANARFSFEDKLKVWSALLRKKVVEI